MPRLPITVWLSSLQQSTKYEYHDLFQTECPLLVISFGVLFGSGYVCGGAFLGCESPPIYHNLLHPLACELLVLDAILPSA